MKNFYEDSAFVATLALLFSVLATASTIVALFQPGSTPLA